MKDINIPKIGLGTYGLTGKSGTEAVLSAIEIGYRHLDTAQSYDTEIPVGAAIDSCGIARADLFVTTKIKDENFSQLRSSLRESCDNLQVDHVDLCLIHWPAPYEKIPVSAYIGELLKAQEEGLTRLIGVSNFTRKHLKDVDDAIGTGHLATNQFECHPYLQNRLLAQHCQDNGIGVTAYQPMAGGKTADDPVLTKIGESKGATATQVSLAFLLQKGYVVIPKSKNPDRMRLNFEAVNVHLSPEDMSAIEALERNQRTVDPEWGPDWD
ncbi:MAG: aldo/keto reductase [Paracoccaceae bacterium]